MTDHPNRKVKTPAWKRAALAVYNPVVNWIRHLYQWLRTLSSQPWTDCSICGRKGPKRLITESVGRVLVELWGLDADTAFSLRLKESLICPWCGSKHRGRRLAEAFLELTASKGDRFECLKDFAKACEAHRSDSSGVCPFVLVLNRVDGLSETLAGCRNVVLTDFIEGAEPGEIRQNIRHEDAQNLSFEDAAFDIVISSETLEHIPNLDRALSEIRRVLRPEGVHIFTIPMKPGTLRTKRRMTIDEQGRMIDLLLPRIHHPGGSWGWPVFTEFGEDFPQSLEARGWKVDMNRSDSEDSKSYGTPCVCDVYITKPMHGPPFSPLVEQTASHE